MRPCVSRLRSSGLAMLTGLIVCIAFHDQALAVPPGPAISSQLQERFGLNEGQVRGALGALLVYARDRLPKPQFDQLAARIPNGEQVMQEVKMQGIVNGPLDDLDEYEATLSNLGIGQPMASQFAPAVLEYLGEAGFTIERDMLARTLR
jgi:hypothetical protein